MLSLSGPSDKSIRNQIAEAVSLIAELDFPTHWPDLIDVRYSIISCSSKAKVKYSNLSRRFPRRTTT